ncbi:hypothetical protein [Kibdelosporangium aridum]|uniref:hypothetical protein n=1 Tax=Kibdelosporangium aridum TaxID=2030 RepID=UPI0035EA1C39
MLSIAPYAAEAHTQVNALISGNETTPIPSETRHGAERDQESRATLTNAAEATCTAETTDDLAEALRINEHHWAQRNRPVSPETLRKQLHVGAARARELTSTVRTMDRTTLAGQPSGTLD